MKSLPFPANLAFVLLALGLSVTGCFAEQDNPVSEEAPDTSLPRPDQESFDVELYESISGEIRYRVRAAYMATYDTPDSTFTLLSRRPQSDASVRVQLYDGGSDSPTTIDAAGMRLFEADHRFEARGNVVVETPEGRRLETEYLVWQEDERRVFAPGFVKIKSPTEDVQGYGFDSDEKLETFSLKRVTGRYYLEDE